MIALCFSSLGNGNIVDISQLHRVVLFGMKTVILFASENTFMFTCLSKLTVQFASVRHRLMHT
jgi:hypothetical protein